MYQRDIVPGEAVDLTGDVGHSVGDADVEDKYESSSSAEEKEFQEDAPNPLQLSTFGRACSAQSQAYVLINFEIKEHNRDIRSFGMCR